VENYLEAVGVITALKAGITLSSLSRPLAASKIENRKFETQQLRQEKSIKEVKT
jgi:hypothetical protein